jgi:hypothetical protein
MRRCLPAIVLVTLFAGSAAALDLPSRKAGLWEVKMIPETTQATPPSMYMCIDAATDKLLQEKFSGHESCSKHDVSKSGGMIVIDSICKFGNVPATTRAVFEGDFDSSYTAKISTTMEGGDKMNMTMKATWQGPCKPGQKGGDVEMPGGIKLNVLDMPK